jgi:hypothetical protein
VAVAQEQALCMTVAFVAVPPQVLDVAEVLGVSRSIPIAIRGEAYDIHIDLKFPQESFAGVDFGALRVVDDCVKQIVLKNTEKYDVKFNFAITIDEVRQLITITPDTGILPPGKDATVAVSQPRLASSHQVVVRVCCGDDCFCCCCAGELHVVLCC